MPFDASPQPEITALDGQTAMFRKRREDAAALWQKIPASEFDMAAWECGSMACALGWLAHNRHDGWLWEDEAEHQRAPKYCGAGSPNYSLATCISDSYLGAAAYFGINYATALRIFNGSEFSRSLTPETVGKTLLQERYPTHLLTSRSGFPWYSTVA